MGILGSIAKGIKGIANVGPVKSVAKMVPGVATAYTAFDLAEKATGGFGGLTRSASPSGPPPLPAGMGVPAGADHLPGTPGAHPSMGKRSIFRDDPNVVEALKPWAIPARDLRPYYRAPKGFVVMYDSAGDPFGIPKQLAKTYLGWKPSKKPPISVRDWSALKRADRTIGKLRKIESTAKKVANFRAPSRSRRTVDKNPQYVIMESGPGSVRKTTQKIR